MNQTILGKGGNWAMLIVRLVIGGIFIYSGWTKVSDMPTLVGVFSSMHISSFLSYIVSYGELIGGALLVLGFWTDITAVFLAVIMIVAIFLTRTGGFSVIALPLSVLSSLVAILGSGSGKYTVMYLFPRAEL